MQISIEPKAVGFVRWDIYFRAEGEEGPVPKDIRKEKLLNAGLEKSAIVIDYKPLTLFDDTLKDRKPSEIVIPSLFDAGTSINEICEFMKSAAEKQLPVVVLGLGIRVLPDSDSMKIFKGFLDLAKPFAEEIQAIGRYQQSASGKTYGRPNSMTNERVELAKALLKQGKSNPEIVAELQKLDGPSIGQTTFWKWKKKYMSNKDG